MPARPPLVDFDVNDKLPEWAEGLIGELSRTWYFGRYQINEFSVEQRDALAHIASEALTHRRSAMRRVAVWVVGELDIITEDTPLLLSRLLYDRVALVRMAAAWACGELGEDAKATVPGLIDALHDPNGGVRFAAVCSLGKLGELAIPAVAPLLSIAVSKDTDRTRDMALKALADIAPNHPDVHWLMAQRLNDPSTDSRFFAAYGIGQAENCSEEGVARLMANIEAADPYLVEISAWAIGKLGSVGEKATPAMLAAMKRFHWIQIEHSELPGEEFFSIRPVFGEALERILPATDDHDYEEFRLRFFSLVFHPTPLEKTAWIDEIVNHRWYLKLQRRRFGHPTSVVERQAIRQMVYEAQAKFAARLWTNPTLGLQPEKYRLLPGFIKNHCRNIAWRLQKQKANPQATKIIPRSAAAFAAHVESGGSDDEVSQQICEFIETHLPGEEREVARCRWALGLTIAETASLLKLTPSQVKTRERKARATAERFREQGEL